MPELPEIEVNKQYIDATSLHQKIDSLEYGDDILFDVSHQKLGQYCVGKSFTRTQRLGKHLLIKIEDGPWLALHFGMTGSLEYYERSDYRPDYWGLLIHFKNHYTLAFICPRKFGKIKLTGSPDEYREDIELGTDAYEISEEKFLELFSKKRGMIKTAFMDQSTMCGLGNIYTDEILFQSGIHPKKNVSSLSKDQLKTLFRTMKDVLETCIDRGAEYKEYPDDYIIPNREEGAECPKGKGKIEKIKVSGRSTYYCPSLQAL